MFVWTVLLVSLAVLCIVLGMTGVSSALVTVGYALVWVSLLMFLAFLVAGIFVGRETARRSGEGPIRPGNTLPPL